MRGLYAITPETTDLARLVEQVRCAIAGGTTIVQYRNKQIGKESARTQAMALRKLTRASGTLLIVNDSADLAFSVGADGVHIGRDDSDAHAIAKIRKQGESRESSSPVRPFMIGVSCYNELQRAESAVSAGADYVAFGSFFSSTTKPNAVRADAALLNAAKAKFDIPVVAIGGITVENAGPLIEAKVDAVAVISGLFDAPDIESRARAFSNLFISGNHVRQ
jgi:thiamine-phosphate pyrophosphorylase